MRARDLDWVVLRPGHLTDSPGTHQVRLAASVPRGDVPRDDVAAVLVALVEATAGGMTLELVSGGTDIDAAVQSL